MGLGIIEIIKETHPILDCEIIKYKRKRCVDYVVVS